MILLSLLYTALLSLWLRIGRTSIGRRERRRVEGVAKKERTWAVAIT